jgi:Lar family restriction alleviation protein
VIGFVETSSQDPHRVGATLRKEQTMKETELKPCPFCGNVAKRKIFTSPRRFFRTTVHYIACTICKCQTPVQLTKEEAETIWNRRADNEQREAD